MLDRVKQLRIHSVCTIFEAPTVGGAPSRCISENDGNCCSLHAFHYVWCFRLVESIEWENLAMNRVKIAIVVSTAVIYALSMCYSLLSLVLYYCVHFPVGVSEEVLEYRLRSFIAFPFWVSLHSKPSEMPRQFSFHAQRNSFSGEFSLAFALVQSLITIKMSHLKWLMRITF